MGLLFTPQGEITEHPAHALTKVAYLNELCFDGIPEAYRNQQKYENVV